MILDKKIQKKLVKNKFYFNPNIVKQSKKEYYIVISKSTPGGEGWWEIFWFDGTYKGFTDEIGKRVKNFDIDNEVEMYLPFRGEYDCPESIIGLIRDAKWKQRALEKLLNDLQENKMKKKKITKKYIKNELCDFLKDKMDVGDASEISDVLAAKDDSIVIKCINGEQIKLVIKVN